LKVIPSEADGTTSRGLSGFLTEIIVSHRDGGSGASRNSPLEWNNDESTRQYPMGRRQV
uniref:Movement protein n=1 Tax=Ascaris lumbricoides TaxID=6252 RepID=A0A0M3I6V1_ASCLU